MGIRIRPARAEDAEPMVTGILNPIIRTGAYTAMKGPVSVDDQRRFIREFPENGVFHVAVEDADGRLVGLQDVLPVDPERGDAVHTGDVSTFVALDTVRAGIGRALCRATFPRARGLGFRTLRAFIRADNPHALAFYESQGFVAVAVFEGGAMVGGRAVDQVLAVLNLDAD